MPLNSNIENVFNKQVLGHIDTLPTGPAVSNVYNLRGPEVSMLRAINGAIKLDAFKIQDWIRREDVSPIPTADLIGTMVVTHFTHVSGLVRSAEVIARGGHDAATMRRLRPVGFAEVDDSLNDRMAELVTQDPMKLADMIMENAGEWKSATGPNPEHAVTEKIIYLGGERLKRVLRELATRQPPSESPRPAFLP